MPTGTVTRRAIRQAIPAMKSTPSQLKRYFEAKLAAELGPHNVKRLIDSGERHFVILDVREADAYGEGHLPGAVNIPFEELPARLKDLPKAKEIISYCWNVTCFLSTKAACFLASKGFKAREMVGGIDEWEKSGFPVEK